MLKIMSTGMVCLIASFPLFAKSPNLLCNNVTDPAFHTGNGTLANPYLICNQSQLARLSTEPALLSQNFKLGSDLSFTHLNFQPIGSLAHPFVGGFNGDDYTLSSITISTNQDYTGIFSNLSHATIQKLNINGLTLKGNSNYYVGGLAGYSNTSNIHNIKLKNLAMKGPDYSGGLIGFANNDIISNIVVQGTIFQNYGTDASGGLIGWANSINMSSCAAHVDLVQTSPTAFGVSFVGGLIGDDYASDIKDCYADGKIDYSAATIVYGTILPHEIGGLIGGGGLGNVNFLYYAGKIIISNAEQVGAACGEGAIGGSSIFWDNQLSIINTSTCGSGEPTATMKSATFWIFEGFNPSVWNIVDGAYPKLQIEG